MTNSNRPALLIDGMNLFVRMMHAFVHTTTDGREAGGLAGFLQALARYINDFKPSVVCVAWEFHKSPIRLSMHPKYKAHRKNNEDSLVQFDRIDQLLRLVSILKHTPVCQVYVDGCEGDDIVAFLCHEFNDRKRIIVSNDKDFYQLVDNDTIVFSPASKTWITQQLITCKFGITPANFAIFKSICGDPSDNIDGVRGIGEKTFKKTFLMAHNTCITLDDLIEMCSNNNTNNQAIDKITMNIDVVKRNWNLIQLFDSILTDKQAQFVRDIITQRSECMCERKFMRAFIDEGLLINQAAFIGSITYLFEAATKL